MRKKKQPNEVKTGIEQMWLKELSDLKKKL